ncbi:MAG: hypothetical protein A4S09_04115 [Proteobacteria bacterium SG_bin7]|nr:MAG: hypothetical protein A4S09_04115 [Proteobacteria bacterium SG_bin7]
MEPRRSSSVKWVLLPQEYCKLALEVFETQFVDRLDGAQLMIEGRIYREELIVRLGFLRPNTIRQINFEASVDFDLNKENAFELLNFLMDPLASWLESFLETKEIEFPPLWKKHRFKNRDVYMQYSTVNSKLEAEADRLLGLEHGLLNADEDGLTEEEQKDQPLH